MEPLLKLKSGVFNMKINLNLKALHKKVNKRHEEIQVGQEYFLSNFYDQEGCRVQVLEKTKEKNQAGFFSTVKVKILDRDLPKHLESLYEIGSVRTVNACNLYDRRELASAKLRYK